jgi:hypothetical protein
MWTSEVEVWLGEAPPREPSRWRCEEGPSRSSASPRGEGRWQAQAGLRSGGSGKRAAGEGGAHGALAEHGQSDQRLRGVEAEGAPGD